MRIPSILVLMAALTLSNCNTAPPVEGLWIVESVRVGGEEMTPNARWTRFNADHTQESGNGRFQHSYGTWELDPASGELSILTTNGVADTGDPFVVSLEEDRMRWERIEEGQNVNVTLVRATDLPETYGDKLLGLWKLEKAVGDGDYFGSTEGGPDGSYVFFRWDKRFVLESVTGRVNGVYNVHGHKPEVEMIPYGDQLARTFWEIQFTENGFTLKLLNTDRTVTREFRRIHQFPGAYRDRQ